MVLWERLRELRAAKDLSQGDIEKRTGLLRCYISRVENGHTVPALETLEKLARAMDVELYQLFYDGGDDPPTTRSTGMPTGLRGSGKDARTLDRFRRLLSRMTEEDQELVISIAKIMSERG